MSNNVSTSNSMHNFSMFISVCILLTAIALSIGSIVHYHQQINDIQASDSTGNREKVYLNFYVTIGCIITFLEVIVFIFILIHSYS